MKKILYIVANVRVSNGVTSVLMNHYQKLLNSGYQMDFCALYDRESPYLEVIQKNGGNYYLLPQIGDKPDEKKSEAAMRSIIASGDYAIVHIHITGRYAVMASKLAKKYKIPYRIYHSHNPRDIHNLHSLLYTAYYDTQCIYSCNKYLACSNLAGKSMFGNKRFAIVKNTIDTKKYTYSEENRTIIRDKYGIRDDDFILGTVCRQTYQKNPLFIIDVFEQLHACNNKSKLLWVGTGEMEEEVKNYVKKKELESSVIFAGSQTNVEQFYSAMDVFVLPSRFEGLGIVYIEAQACGLPTFASDVVPEDIAVTDLVSFIPLKEDASVWAEKILKANNKMPVNKRRAYAKCVADKGYDSVLNNDLCEYYDNLF